MPGGRGPRPARPPGRGSWMPGAARATGTVPAARAGRAGGDPAPRDASRWAWWSWSRPSHAGRDLDGVEPLAIALGAAVERVLEGLLDGARYLAGLAGA